MMMQEIHSCEDLDRLVQQIGFLPFFRNEIEGFSIEEITPRNLWFSDVLDGPWEWKGPVASNGMCAYGKLFNGKAGFVSRDWYRDLMNYRRDCYRLNVESIHPDEQLVYNKVVEHESLLSKEIKKICGYQKLRKKRLSPMEQLVEDEQHMPHIRSKREGFDTVMTHLQMGTYLIIADFEYQYDKQGNRFGWGIARYTTPEVMLSGAESLKCDGRSPQESFERMVEYLSRLLPEVRIERIIRLLT